jgi:hypothetical protein
MEIAIVLFVGIVFGWNVREIYAVHQTRKFLSQIDFTEHQQDNLKRIVIEKQGETFFVYSKEDNSFMAQGGSLKELEANLASRYPGTRFGASNDNLKEVGILK